MLTYLVNWVLNLPVLVYVTIALAVVWYLRFRPRLPEDLPPFPAKPYPVIGHLSMMAAQPLETLHNWKTLVGDVFSIYMGPQLVVVLNSYDVIKEAFVKHADYFSDRPDNLGWFERDRLGIVFNSGPEWKEQRTVSTNILRSLGMGKNWLAEKITEEVSFYLESLSEFKGQPTDLRLLTNTSVSNVICAILVGRRFEFDDVSFTKLLHLLDDQTSLLGNTKAINIYPWLQYIPGDLFSAKRTVKNSEAIDDLFSDKFLTEAKEAMREGREELNFITMYLKEMEEKKLSNKPTSLSEAQLLRVTSNLYAAGSETTSTSIMWALLFAINYPKKQEKVYQEIVEVVGTDRLPTLYDKSNMTYLNAFIMETQRVGCITPLGLTHGCSRDVKIAGYTIPKGTTIIPNLNEILRDENVYEDPSDFRPERFLDEENNLNVPEEFIPFSIGRRYCVGESMAKMELFLFLAGIFQQFQLVAEDPNNTPPMDPVIGITSAPKAFKVAMKERGKK